MFPVSRLPRRPALRDADDLVAALQTPFSDEQLAAITAPLEPTVIIAGAGTGKTTVMAARVVWLVGSGQVRPEQVLGLTFTRKAAAELAQRIQTALVRANVLTGGDPADAGEQVILTYDSFAARLVSEHGLWLGYEAEPTMLTGAARHQLAARVVGAATGPFQQLARLQPASVIDRVLTLDGQLQSHLVDEPALAEQTRSYLQELAAAPKNRYRQTYASVRRAEATARERLEIASLVRAYADLKHELGLVEFSDQMAAAARLADSVALVGHQLREQFRIVLLDEYQDTSSAQAALLSHLFSGQPGAGHPVTAVGDPFQAIYGWRGAAPSNIMRFATDFPRRDGSPAAVLPLTVNRRSGPAILHVANQLAGPLRADASLAYDLSQNLLCAPDTTPSGAVETALLSTWPDEVSWLADRIEHAHATAQAPSWSEIAVLARRNQDIGPVFAALRERDIPAEVVGLGGLLTLPEVADVVSTLRLIADVTANPDLVRLLTGPRWNIGPGDLELLGQRARELAASRQQPPEPNDDPLGQALAEAVAETDPSERVSLAEALTDLGEGPFSDVARERFAQFGAELEMLRRHATEPVTDLVRRVVVTLGLEVELGIHARGDDPTAQLGAFADAVAGYTEVDTDASLKGLLGFIDAELRYGTGLEQATLSAADSVKLLTIHKAKGLEWEVVLLPALCDKIFPSDRVTDNWVTSAAMIPAELRGDAASVPQLDEAADAGFIRYQAALTSQNRRSEDRLAYVAVTRARRLLIGSSHAWRASDKRQRLPSPYLLTLEEAAHLQGRAWRAPIPAENPLQTQTLPVDWPAEASPQVRARRQRAATLVQTMCGDDPAAVALRRETEAALAAAPSEVADLVAGWDDEMARLVGEARAVRRSVVEVPTPASLTATEVMLAARDPDALAARLARPMPRPASAAARFGTRFHEWVLRHFQSPTLLDPDDLDTDDVTDDIELRQLCEAFAAGQFAETVPAALEASFSLLVGASVIRGRIDAAYFASPMTPPGMDALVVDWKTGASPADPLQLALYRLAWAELNNLELDRVAAGFYHVRSDRLQLVTGLPDRDGVETVVTMLGYPSAEPVVAPLEPIRYGDRHENLGRPR